jgi:hypothetical protein
MNMKPYQGWFVSPGTLDRKVLAIIESTFDAETDALNAKLAEDAEREKESRQAIRTICVMRTLSFPLDILTIAAFLPFEYVQRRLRLQRDFLKFLFWSADYKDVAKSLSENG